jgi:hypothetical protein
MMIVVLLSYSILLKLVHSYIWCNNCVLSIQYTYIINDWDECIFNSIQIWIASYSIPLDQSQILLGKSSRRRETCTHPYSTNVPCQVNGCPGKEVDYPDALQCSLQVSLFIKTPWSHHFTTLLQPQVSSLSKSALKGLKCEIFNLLDFCYFYIT